MNKQAQTNNLHPWHDARVERRPKGVSNNNAVIVVGLRRGRIAYKHLYRDWEELYKNLEFLVTEYKKCYEQFLWAYLRDLVPGVKEKGL